MNISEKTAEFLRGCYQDRVDIFLDDPDEVCANYTELLTYMLELAAVGKEIGKPISAAIKESPFELNRLINVFNEWKEEHRTWTDADRVNTLLVTEILREFQ